MKKILMVLIVAAGFAACAQLCADLPVVPILSPLNPLCAATPSPVPAVLH